MKEASEEYRFPEPQTPKRRAAQGKKGAKGQLVHHKNGADQK